MVNSNLFSEEQRFLSLLLEESHSKQVGFQDVHEISRLQKKNPPRMEEALKLYKGIRTHFSSTGIKSK